MSRGRTELALCALAVVATVSWCSGRDPASHRVSEVELAQRLYPQVIVLIDGEIANGRLAPELSSVIRDPDHFIVFARRTKVQGRLRAAWFVCEKRQGNVHIHAKGRYGRPEYTIEPEVMTFEQFSRFARVTSAFRDKTYTVEKSGDCGVVK